MTRKFTRDERFRDKFKNVRSKYKTLQPFEFFTLKRAAFFREDPTIFLMTKLIPIDSMLGESRAQPIFSFCYLLYCIFICWLNGVIFSALFTNICPRSHVEKSQPLMTILHSPTLQLPDPRTMPGADSDRQTDGGDHAAGAEGDQQRSPQRDTADGGRQVFHHLRAGPAERQR